MLVESVKMLFGAIKVGPGFDLEFLSDNGGAFRAKDTQTLAKDSGIKPIHTPVSSPQSKGIADSSMDMFKRNCVSRMDRGSANIALRQMPSAFKHFNEEVHPHSLATCCRGCSGKSKGCRPLRDDTETRS
jgi:hypothetical protein